MIEITDTDYAADYDTDYKRPIMTDIFSKDFFIALKISDDLFLFLVIDHK